jgi:calcium-dependent protein kinase
MGGAESSESSVPPSLFSIQTFLIEANSCWQQYLRLKENGCNDTKYIYSLRRIIYMYIFEAFRLAPILGVTLDANGTDCLEYFHRLSNHLSSDSNLNLMPIKAPNLNPESLIKYEHNYQLLAESDAILSMAESLVKEGPNFYYQGALYYHLCTIFYVKISKMSSGNDDLVQQRLQYSSWKCRKYSDLRMNIINEHFIEGVCGNDYNINPDNLIGKGSYGLVYLAHHRITQREQAIKAMNVDKCTSYYLKKLHIEISILKELDHPNIIKIKEVYFGKQTVYIVSNLCKGGELFDLINRGKQKGFVFKESRAVKLISDMLSSVHYLHGRRIVHRDLKLENFLFEENSSSASLILIDFGLAYRFEPGEILTQKVGSCYYTAPEVIAGHYDYRCDLYSIGVLAYMIICGSSPFTGKTVEDVYEATFTGILTFPEEKFQHVSQQCVDFISLLLEKNPDKRMTSQEALMHPFILQGSTGKTHKLDSPLGMVQLDITKLPADIQMKNDNETTISLSPERVEEIVRSIITFLEVSPLIRLTLGVVSTLMGVELTRQFRKEFLLLDYRREGLISLPSFYNTLMDAPSVFCGEIDLVQAYAVVAQSMKHRQKEGITFSGYISCALIGKVFIQDMILREAFTILAADGDNKLTTSSLKMRLGDDLSDDELRNIIVDGDQRRSGYVNYEDFERVWRIFEQKSCNQKYLVASRINSISSDGDSVWDKDTYVENRRCSNNDTPSGSTASIGTDQEASSSCDDANMNLDP